MKKLLITSALMLSFASVVQASQPIEMVVGLAPGGLGDLSARLISKHLEKKIGQSIVVVNKPGAGQVIAAGYLSKAKKNAVIGHMTNAIITSELTGLSNNLYKSEQFEPLCQLNSSPSVLIARNELGIKSLNDLEKYLENSKLTAGHQGNGSANHYRLVMLNKYRQIDVDLIPFKGESEVMTNIMGDHIDLAAVSPLTAQKNINSGKYNVVFSWDEVKGYPDIQVPNLISQFTDIPDVGVKLYLWGNKSYDKEFNENLKQACAAVAADADFVKEYISAGMEIVFKDAKQAKDELTRDVDLYKKIIKEVH